MLINVTDYWVREEGLVRWIQFVTANNEILPLYYLHIPSHFILMPNSSNI